MKRTWRAAVTCSLSLLLSACGALDGLTFSPGKATVPLGGGYAAEVNLSGARFGLRGAEFGSSEAPLAFAPRNGFIYGTLALPPGLGVEFRRTSDVPRGSFVVTFPGPRGNGLLPPELGEPQ